MKKKINLLSSLLLVAFALGIVSFCSSTESIDAATAGAQEAYYEYNTMYSSFEKGYEAGLKTREKIPFQHCSVALAPIKYSDYPDKVMNTISGEEVRMSMREIRLLIPGKNKLSWISLVLCIIVFFGCLYFIWALLSFVAAVKRGKIFVRSNEWKLKGMAFVFLLWFVADWITEYIAYSDYKSVVAIEGYKVAMEHPSVFSLVMGITFLLFSVIFSFGRKLEEDQEFTV